MLIDNNAILLPASNSDILRHRYITEALGTLPDVTDKLITLNKKMNILDTTSDITVKKENTVILFGIGDGYEIDEPADTYEFHLKNIIPIKNNIQSRNKIIPSLGDYGLRTSVVINDNTYDIWYLKKVNTANFKHITGSYDEETENAIQVRAVVKKEELKEYFDLYNSPTKDGFNELTLYFGTVHKYRDPRNANIEHIDYINVVPFHRFKFDKKTVSANSDFEFVFNFKYGFAV